MYADRTGKLGTQHRQALRAILGVGNKLCNELVYVLLCEMPVSLHISKALFRYMESWKNDRLIAEVATWTAMQEEEDLPTRQPLKWI